MMKMVSLSLNLLQSKDFLMILTLLSKDYPQLGMSNVFFYKKLNLNYNISYIYFIFVFIFRRK